MRLTSYDIDPKLIPELDNRNKLVIDFFHSKNIDISLFGSIQKPIFVLCDCLRVAGYVRYGTIFLTDHNINGNLLNSFNLINDFKNTSRKQIIDIIRMGQHLALYRLAYNQSNPDLYLSRYDFKDRTNRQGIYPIFSKEEPYLYRTKEKAKEIIAEYRPDG